MAFREFYYNSLLFEANADKRIDYLTNKYGEKLNAHLERMGVWDYQYPGMISEESVIPFIVKTVDPKEGEYSEWIIKCLLNMKSPRFFESWFLEDYYKVTDDLKEYSKYKKFFKKRAEDDEDPSIAKYSDINQIKDFADLYTKMDLLYPYVKAETEKENMKAAEKEVDKIYASDKFLIISPKTEAASCAYGRGTRWCTAATGSYNAFNQYNRQGPLYIIIDRETQEKFQFHFQSESYMDKDDYSIEWDEFFSDGDGHRSELRPILAELAMKNDMQSLALELDESLFEKMYENYKAANITQKIEFVNLVKHDLGLLLMLAKISNEDANEIQDYKYFDFKGDDVWVNAGDSEWSELVDFIKDSSDRERSYAKSVLDMEYEESHYYSPFDKDFYDYVNNEHMLYIQKYINAEHGESISINDIRDYEDEDVEALLSRAFDSMYNDYMYNNLYEGAIEAIVDGLGGEYERRERDYIWFKMSFHRLVYIWSEIKRDTDEAYPVGFIDLYAKYLDENGEGGDFDPNRITNDYPSATKDNMELFNEYLSNNIHSDLPIREDIEEHVSFNKLFRVIIN
jgi:hypothetical protein